jgi:hypothetical protein
MESHSLPRAPAIAAAWLSLFGLTLALYTPFLSAPYFADDLLFYFNSPPPHLVDYFWVRGYASQAYRPGEAIILTLIQSHFGFNTLPIHLVSMAAHASLCCMVWIAALRLGYGRLQALLACVLTLVTQMGAPALLDNDTISQAMSAALGGAACLLLGIACLDYVERPGRQLSRGYLTASALCYFMSLFFKETALGLILVITLFTGLVALRKESGRERIYFALRSLIPYGVLIAVYFVARLHAGAPVSGGGRYDISVGMNVIKNLALFGLAAVSPISTVTVALAAQGGRAVMLGLISLALLLVAVTVLAGIWTSSRRNIAALLVGCILAALFPAFLLQRVSELYVYNASPYIALLIALSLGSLAGRGIAVTALMAACSVLLIGGQVFANRQKAFLRNGNGESAAAMMKSIAEYMQRLPPDSEVWLIQVKSAALEYSEYVMSGIDVLEDGVGRIGPIYGRPDVKVKFVSKQDLEGVGPDAHRLVLELRDGVLTQAALCPLSEQAKGVRGCAQTAPR